jgi:FkbM family methyltransferase
MECILFDIGANVGNYTRKNIEKYNKIICVEPIYNLCKDLPSKCVIVNKVVSDVKDVNFYKRDGGISTVSYEWMNGGRFSSNGKYFNKSTDWELYPCETVTLDELIKEHGTPNFIKIDVEGYEYNVIKSLSRVFKGTIALEWAEEMKIEVINCIEYLYKTIGHSMFHIQLEDCYTYIPDEDSWISKDEVLKYINEAFVPERQDLWGMLWSKP